MRQDVDDPNLPDWYDQAMRGQKEQENSDFVDLAGTVPTPPDVLALDRPEVRRRAWEAASRRDE